MRAQRAIGKVKKNHVVGRHAQCLPGRLGLAPPPGNQLLRRHEMAVGVPPVCHKNNSHGRAGRSLPDDGAATPQCLIVRVGREYHGRACQVAVVEMIGVAVCAADI